MKIRKIVSILLISAVALTSIGCMPLSEHIDYNAEWVMVIESLSNPEERITIKNSDNSSVATRERNSHGNRQQRGGNIRCIIQRLQGDFNLCSR